MTKPKTARREALWLEAINRLGWTVKEVAEAAGLSVRRIQAGLRRARQEPLDLPTIWEIQWRSSPNAFTAEHQCAFHGGPGTKIPEEFPVGCLFCLEAGLSQMIARHGRKIGSPTETTADSPAEIAATVQPDGPAIFKPRVKRPKATRTHLASSKPSSGSSDSTPLSESQLMPVLSGAGSK